MGRGQKKAAGGGGRVARVARVAVAPPFYPVSASPWDTLPLYQELSGASLEDQGIMLAMVPSLDDFAGEAREIGREALTTKQGNETVLIRREQMPAQRRSGTMLANELVGVAKIYEQRTLGGDRMPPQGRYTFIADLATRGTGRGWGRQMILDVAKIAARRGQGLWLHSLNKSDGFYRRLGFHAVGEASFWLSPAEVAQMAGSP